jgi:peroxiredoxin
MLLFATPPADPIRSGQRAPGFDLPLLDGGTVSLDALRGKVVLVNFWATWCAPCEAEMPAMQRLYESLRERGFELVAISVDAGRDEVETFRERIPITFPIALDPEKRAAGAYQSHRFPESFLVDREGVLRARYIGPRDWDAPVYVEHIRRVIEGESDAAPPQ